MTTKIHVEKTNRKKLNLCKFTNGRVKAEEGDHLNCRELVYKEGADAKAQNHKILVAETPEMTYVGQNFGKKSFINNNSSLKYYVGVYDEKTGKMRICDTELFNMLPHIPGRDDTDSKTPQLPKVPAERNYSEKLGMLTEAFGSKWKKSALEKQLRNRVDEQSMKDQLSADIRLGKEQAKLHAESQQVEEVDPMLEIIPPCNKSAEKVEEVYKLSDILSEAEMSSLQTPAQVFFDSTPDQVKQWRGKQVYPVYLLDHVASMPIETDLRWQRSKCLMYLHYMIHLYKMSPNQLRGKNPFLESCPNSIKRKLQDNFTKLVNRTRCMPSRQKDRLAAYILTVCLIMDEFTLELNELMTDMGIQRQRMFVVLKALGCKINKKIKDNEERFSARLKLPLEEPVRTLFRKSGEKKR